MFVEVWLQPGVRASFQKLQHLTVWADQSDDLAHRSLPSCPPFEIGELLKDALHSLWSMRRYRHHKLLKDSAKT